MNKRIVLTGGTGRLGRELAGLLPGVVAPGRGQLDVTDSGSVDAAFESLNPQLVIHAAAYTDVAGAEADRTACFAVNVDGTRHVAAACTAMGVRLVHISTDYVFDGHRGDYHEAEAPGPTRNYYALTKLCAEAAARTAPGSLVIRTSFRPREFPYPRAFDDLFTSQDYVDVIAPMIAQAAWNIDRIEYPVLHIATERKSVYELARRRRPDVQPASKREAGVDLPDDISLNVDRWRSLQPTLAPLPHERSR